MLQLLLSWQGLAIVLVLWGVIGLVKKQRTEKQIRRLGGHAPRVKSWLPCDIDLIIRAVRATRAHRNLENYTALLGPHHTVELCPAGRRLIFTTDPKNIKAILATQFADYGKGEPFHREWATFLGDSIFTTDAKEWHDSRQLLRPQFIKDRVSDLEVFEEHVQVLIRRIEEESSSGSDLGVVQVDISDLLFRYTLDAAMHFLLGTSVNSLTSPDQTFADAFAEVQRIQNLIARSGPLAFLIPRKSFHAGIRVMDQFVTPFIEKALTLPSEELKTKTKSERGYTFLHALAAFTRDRKYLRDQLVALLLAGRDTTASTMSWMFYELARHPEVVRELRSEILRVLGRHRKPTYDDLKGMKYLQYVTNETMRLYAPVPFNVRLALKDTTLPTGGGPDGCSPIGVLKDSPIGYSTLLLHRRADLTPSFTIPSPSDPTQVQTITVNDFYPERWDAEHPHHYSPEPWTYIPFNGGPRICIGQQFALTEMHYTLVRIFQHFERIESFMDAVDGGVPCLKAEIVLQPGQGVRVGFS